MATYTNKAVRGGSVHTVKVGRQRYLDADTSARPSTAKAKTTTRHYVRKGRAAYVNDVNGGRRS